MFAGMEALVEAGVLQGPLPHCMRDAPLHGGKIIVNHGAISSSFRKKQTKSDPWWVNGMHMLCICYGWDA